MIDLAMIQKQGLLFAKRRGLAESPLLSFRHLQSEIIEAGVELEGDNIEELSYELADIILVTLSIAEQKGINMEKALKEKHLINLRRIP